jgi:DNA modification methylase
VLDTFAGSGATGVACHNLGRECVLIERDAKMFSKMQARIDNLDAEVLDSNLFEAG